METIQWKVEGSIATLALNRQEKMNSLNAQVFRDMNQALDEVESNQAIRVLILTGVGRAFCAGQDLTDPEMTKDNKMVNLGEVVEARYKPFIMRMANLRVPIISAVNGTAAGAGANLALAGDIVLASHSASFIQAFTRIGLMPDTGGSWFLPQRVGMARAMGLAMLAESVSAVEAERIGLIWKAFADEVFPAEVQKLAHRLAKMPTLALVRTRQAMHRSVANSLDTQLSVEADYMTELGNSQDFIEGVMAFREKRHAQFVGH